MGLHGSSLFACEVLEPAACHIERLADGHARVAVHAFDVRVFVVRFAFPILQSSVQ